jgi:pimeloyl-ACP methyl ester carboxylesterase
MKSMLFTILKILTAFLLLIGLALVLAYRSDMTLDQLVSKYTDQNSYFLDVHGINMHVKVSGEGEPIFLIHGSFSSLHTWEAWEKELSKYFMTISMDLPGHGLTGPDEKGRYGTADYANFIFGIAELLGIDEFHVAGNSMGGGVALKMAADQPNKILSLNLIDASGAPAKQISESSSPSRSNSSGAAIFKVARNPLVNKILLKCTPKVLFKWNLEQVYFDPNKITEEQVTRYYELILREGNRRATLDRLTSRKSHQVDFGKIKMPVLIMWGAGDRWIPLSSGERLKDTIPGATLKVFQNAGHVPMEEIPTETVLEYLHFLGIQPDVDYLSPPKFFSYVH